METPPRQNNNLVYRIMNSMPFGLALGTGLLATTYLCTFGTSHFQSRQQIEPDTHYQEKVSHSKKTRSPEEDAGTIYFDGEFYWKFPKSKIDMPSRESIFEEGVDFSKKK